ncbi:MAG TPA: SDR family NAD(P)-dependent oxidoreductase, partial [Novosphingobium sp.]
MGTRNQRIQRRGHLGRLHCEWRLLMDFTGQHVVITGGSTGIGRATAEKIVAAGGKVSLIARRADVLE